MCGIIAAATTEREVLPILIDGLKRLEYRGYDSAGVATLNGGKILRVRNEGKVCELEQKLLLGNTPGKIGIAHTRWATHGKPSEDNAHPHIVGDRLAVVHNGIIENYKELIKEFNLNAKELSSETDTEVIAHVIHKYLLGGLSLLQSIQKAVKTFKGAFSFCILDLLNPETIIAARLGSPLVVGIGVREHFLASDPLALQKLSQDFVYLEEGDVVSITKDKLDIFDLNDKTVTRQIHSQQLRVDFTDKGNYKHYMQKEIFEQPKAIKNTIIGKFSKSSVLTESFGRNAPAILSNTNHIQIIACGTSYHAGLVAKSWFESISKIPCSVEIASEFRYRDKITPPNTLFIAISQSGETADTLAAIVDAKKKEKSLYSGFLAICNVPESSIVRVADLVFLTQAGPEIGVASTKSFTTQLASLLLLALAIAQVKSTLKRDQMEQHLAHLNNLPNIIESILQLDKSIRGMANFFVEKQHALFLGRGVSLPIVMEGALKLKEISYIHAEAYPAGELKHGPLALVDKNMPVIVLAPNDQLLEKLKSNISEVNARGGKLFIITEEGSNITDYDNSYVLTLPKVPLSLLPIAFTIPLQLLAYYVAVLKGTDVDQPRNLAKSVTVE